MNSFDAFKRIREKVISVPAIADKIGSRFYFLRVPENYRLPLVAFVPEMREQDFEMPIREMDLTFDIWSKNDVEAMGLMEELNLIFLDRVFLDFNGLKIYLSRGISTNFMIQEEENIYHVPMLFRLKFVSN